MGSAPWVLPRLGKKVNTINNGLLTLSGFFPLPKLVTVNSNDILGNSGRIAQRLENYEERQEQLDMANAVAKAIAEKNHLVVEAGTGVGKSFGYLVPAILSLQAAQEKEDDSKRRIVVSTHTISLQEQLITKDIPLLNSVIPLEFSAVLAKGRGNYLSLRRLGRAMKNLSLIHI